MAASTSGRQHEGLLQSYLRMQPRIFRELEAGGVAGGLAKTCVAPLERTKILFQTRRVSKELGIPGTLKFLWKTEGVSGLFRGNTASVLRITPYAAIHFSVYEHYRRFIQTYVEHSEMQQQKRHSAVQRQHVASMQDLEARLRNSSKKEEQEASAAVSRVLQQLDSLPLVAQPRAQQDTRTAEERAAAVAAVVDRVMEESSASGSSIDFTAAMAAAEAQLDLQATDSSLPASSPHPKAPLHPVWDLVAGSLSGATAVMITYPLDLVRTRLAYATEGAMSDSKANGASSSSSQPQSGSNPSSQATREASSVSASHPSSSNASSPSSSSSVPRSMSSSATSTSTSASSSSSSPSSADSRGVPGVASVQAKPSPHPHHPHHSITSMLREALQAEGPRGLYKGVTPTLLGILPYAGLKFYVYQTLKHAYNRRADRAAAAGTEQERQRREGSKGRLPIPIMLLFGGFAGLLAQTMTYPLDIVRRRMQVEGLSILGKPPSASESRRASTLSIAKAIIREDGARGMFRGLSVNYLKVMPSTAIGFTAYEFLKHYLNVVGNL